MYIVYLNNRNKYTLIVDISNIKMEKAIILKKYF